MHSFQMYIHNSKDLFTITFYKQSGIHYLEYLKAHIYLLNVPTNSNKQDAVYVENKDWYSSTDHVSF